MLIQFVVALIVILIPGQQALPQHSGPFGRVLAYQYAIAQSNRIEAETEREAAARAEAARIEAETAVYVAAIAQAARAEQERAATIRSAITAAPAPSNAVAAPVAAGGALRGEALRQAALAAGWPAEQLANVERVVACESAGLTTARSPAGYLGLMQVAPWLHGAVPADAHGQLVQAREVWGRQGWGAWECY